MGNSKKIQYYLLAGLFLSLFLPESIGNAPAIITIPPIIFWFVFIIMSLFACIRLQSTRFFNGLGLFLCSIYGLATYYAMTLNGQFNGFMDTNPPLYIPVAPVVGLILFIMLGISFIVNLLVGQYES